MLVLRGALTDGRDTGGGLTDGRDTGAEARGAVCTGCDGRETGWETRGAVYTGCEGRETGWETRGTDAGWETRGTDTGCDGRAATPPEDGARTAGVPRALCAAGCETALDAARLAPAEGETPRVGELETAEPAREAGMFPALVASAVRCAFTRAFALAVVLFFEKSWARESTAPRLLGIAESGTPASFIDGPTGLRTAVTPLFPEPDAEICDAACVPPPVALVESEALWVPAVVGLAGV